MQVTSTGWVLVLMGLACLHRPLWLTCLVAASATFSATAVVNFPALPFGMQPYHWFGMLLVVSTFTFRLVHLLKAASPLGKVTFPLYAFIAWGAIATLASGAKGTSIAHIIHLGFGASVMICIVANTMRPPDLIVAVRALVVGTLLAALWGVVELACGLTGISYPAWIFNNSVGEFVSESVVLFIGIPRLNSVSTEPSYLVRSLVPVICLLMGLWLFALRTRLKVTLLHPLTFKISLLTAITLLSTSSLGIVALVLASVVPLVFAARARLYIAGAYVAVASLVGYVALTNPLLVGLADELLFGKLEYGSGTMRIVSVAEAFEAFTAHPIVGAGPGLITSHDLVLKLLSNFGVFGAVFFLWMLGAAARSGVRALKQRRRDASGALILGLLAANLMLWIMDVIAGVSYQYGIFWTLLGLLVSASRTPQPSMNVRSKDRLVQPAFDTAAPRLHHHHRTQ